MSKRTKVQLHKERALSTKRKLSSWKYCIRSHHHMQWKNLRREHLYRYSRNHISWQPDSNREPLVSEHKSLTIKLHALVFRTLSGIWDDTFWAQLCVLVLQFVVAMLCRCSSSRKNHKIIKNKNLFKRNTSWQLFLERPEKLHINYKYFV